MAEFWPLIKTVVEEKIAGAVAGLVEKLPAAFRKSALIVDPCSLGATPPKFTYIKAEPGTVHTSEGRKALGASTPLPAQPREANITRKLLTPQGGG